MDNTEDFYSFNVGSIPASRTNSKSVVKIQQTKRLTMNP